MPIDPLDIPRQTVADFGIKVKVLPTVKGRWPYEITARFVRPTEEVSLGQARGEMAGYFFRCLPEEVVNLAEGDLLNPIGTADKYAAFEILAVPGKLTVVKVVPR